MEHGQNFENCLFHGLKIKNHNFENKECNKLMEIRTNTPTRFKM